MVHETAARTPIIPAAPATAPAEAHVHAAGEWSDMLGEFAGTDELVVNMGPQHPSTHGPIRFTLSIAGESVTDVRITTGFLHTGIEKTMEYRTFTQGVTLCTRIDYVAPVFNEVVYCLAVERLLGITDQVPARASIIRVLLMELNRIASHLVAIGTGGMETGALTVMTNSFRERESILDVLEMITGARMNHGYIRPGGVAADLPAGAVAAVRELIALLRRRLPELHAMCDSNPIFIRRLSGTGVLDTTGCLAMGTTGPVLRATGLPWDLRRTMPYCGYESYEFDIATARRADAYGRYRLRMAEIDESLKIIEQCADRLTAAGPVMVADRKIAWPAQLALGADGLGNSLEHVADIMGRSMESLIHHFKLITEGFRVPVGQAYAAVESPRGELGCHLVSAGGTRPHRIHFRDPSFVNLQAVPAMTTGGQLADFIVTLASVDPVCGGVDR